MNCSVSPRPCSACSKIVRPASAAPSQSGRSWCRRVNPGCVQRLPEARRRFLQAPLLLEKIAEVVVRVGVTRVAPQRLLERLVSLGLFAQVRERVAQVVVCLGAVGTQAQRLALARGRLGKLAL